MPVIFPCHRVWKNILTSFLCFVKRIFDYFLQISNNFYTTCIYFNNGFVHI